MDEINRISHQKLPSTAREYAAAIEQISSGRFTSRFNEGARKYFASQYGAPFYAISQLAPEVLDKPNLNVVFGGPVDVLAKEGGRWLSLYQRAIKIEGKISAVICVSAKPKPIKAPKPLLFQPPQAIVIKHWARYINEVKAAPDLIVLYAPHSFNEHLNAIKSLLELKPSYKILMAFQSRAEAILLKPLVEISGFSVTEPLGFMNSESECQHFNNGAWWLSLSYNDKIIKNEDYETLLESVRSGYIYLEQFISVAESDQERSDIAAMYGKWFPVRIGESNISNCFHFSSKSGIDLNSGKRFINHSDSINNARYEWGDISLTDDLLEMVPSIMPELTEDANRFRRMIWLAKAFTQNNKREDALIESKNALLANENTQDELIEALGVSSAKDQIEFESSAESTAIDSNGMAELKPKIQYSRLSRETGTVNVLAVAARLGILNKKTNNEFEKTKILILGWLKNKGYSGLAVSGNTTIELPYGEVTIETDDKSVWSMRYDDRQKMEQGAFWRVEATLINADEPAIGLRLSQIRKSADAPEPVSGAPKVIATIASDIGLHDAGVQLSNQALFFKGVKDANTFIRLLLKPERTHPIIAISNINATKIDPSVNRLAARLTGVAHVICIDNEISDRMTNIFGRERSLFGNAIRLYRPGFSDRSDPFMNRKWKLNGSLLPVWIANDVAEEACAISLEVGDVDERVPSFHAIRNLLSETKLETLQRQSKSIALSAEEEILRQVEIQNELESLIAKYKMQNSELELRVNELINNLRSLKIDLQETRRERDDALDENRALQNKFANQWLSASRSIETIEYQTTYPDSWDDLETWVELYGDGKLELHPLAAKAARESPYLDIPFAYKALEYLVKYYVPMRTRSINDNNLYNASQNALKELGLELSKVGTAVEMNRYKQEYRRQYNGKSIWLEDHLKKGVGFDPEVIFRLYFYYDEDNTKVVVGHFPTHLTNRTTHTG